MDLKDIMAVSGKSGLFKFVSQARNGIIVESFVDQKKVFVSGLTKISSLEDIAIFTDDEEIPLKEVFKKIAELDDGSLLPDSKSSPEELKAFMEKVLSNYDRDRVYVSDIKKIVTWYAFLKEKDLLIFDEEEKQEPEQEATPESGTEE